MRKTFLAAFITAFLLRLATIAFVDVQPLEWDARHPNVLLEYGVIAHYLYQDEGYSYHWIKDDGSTIIIPTAYMPPGQVYLNYALFCLLGDSENGLVGIFLLNVLLGSFSVLLIGLITTHLFGIERLTKLSLWLAVIYPPFIYSTMTFGITSSVIALGLWVLVMCIRFISSIEIGKPSLKYAALAGVGLGLLCLFRGEAPLYAAMAIAVFIYKGKKHLSTHFSFVLSRTAVCIIVTMAILAPWVIRNYQTFDRLIIISSNGGLNFWRGNNPYTGGSPWTDKGSSFWTTDELWQKASPYLDSGAAAFDKKYSEVYFDDALKWIQDHPAEALSQAAKKAAIFWTFDPRLLGDGRLIFYLCCYLPILCGSVYGLIHLLRNTSTSKSGLYLIMMWCITATIVAMVFIPLPRLQVIMSSIIFPVSCYGLYHLASRYADAKR